MLDHIRKERVLAYLKERKEGSWQTDRQTHIHTNTQVMSVEEPGGCPASEADSLHPLQALQGLPPFSHFGGPLFLPSSCVCPGIRLESQLAVLWHMTLAQRNHSVIHE